MGFNLTDLEKLEALHAEVRPSAPAEIYQAFSEMAKALREAWERDERVMSDERMSEQQITATINEVILQRDEAIRLGDERLATLWDEKKVEIAKLTKERDEARAEVARLREAVRKVHALAAQGDDPTHGWIDPTLREIHEITKRKP